MDMGNSLRRVVTALAACAALAGCGSPGPGGANGGGGGVTTRSEVACSQHSDERLATMTDDGIGMTSSRGLAPGRFALPATGSPTQLVMMFHGHGNDSCAWRNHLRNAAALGAVAVAMDYVEQVPVENYGWAMRRAAAESNDAAKHFLAAYPSITEVFAFGISMGGNASIVAIAAPDAVRADGSPLYDWWVDVEGVNNLVEEYSIIRLLATVDEGAALAQQEIEEENGGTLEQQPANYAEITGVVRAPDMSGLKGAVIVNGLDDGLVTTDNSPQMMLAMNLAGVPSHLYTVLLRGEGESGGTLTGVIIGPGGVPYESPLAGHGWEGSETHLVITTGFDQLHALMAGGTVVPGETVVPGF